MQMFQTRPYWSTRSVRITSNTELGSLMLTLEAPVRALTIFTVEASVWAGMTIAGAMAAAVISVLLRRCGFPVRARTSFLRALALETRV